MLILQKFFVTWLRVTIARAWDGGLGSCKPDRSLHSGTCRLSQVTDIADAMMIRQLFAGLWRRGAVVVATSNRPPDHLYHKGLQRAAFLPFISQLEERTHVHSLEESSTDYRLLKVGGWERDWNQSNLAT